MSATATALRRIVLLTLVAVVAGAVLAWKKQRDELALPAGPPQWPEFEAPTSAAKPWVDGSTVDGAPAGYPVKVKLSSGIFHVPGGRFYERTNADRWYATTEAAEADGYRRSKT
jgi:hypothetical protein